MAGCFEILPFFLLTPPSCCLLNQFCIFHLNSSGRTRSTDAAQVAQVVGLLSLEQKSSSQDLFSLQMTAGSHSAHVKDVRVCGDAVENILLPAASSRMTGLAAGQRWYILGGLRRPTCASRRFSDCC